LNEQEQEKYEAELRRTPPARVPEQFMARLKAARGADGQGIARLKPDDRKIRVGTGWLAWQNVWRWLAPAMGLAVVGLLAGRGKFYPESSVKEKPLAVANGLKADDVQVDQELVSSFDVVAKLPGGEPVRFRCQKWRNQLLVTDKSRGIEIEQSNPRVEVVPVRFETY
jgi:hypothetical protein